MRLQRSLQRLSDTQGNVIVELVFSVTLMSAIALPAMTTLATVISARNYATNAAMQLARTWTISTVNERGLAIQEVKSSLIAMSPFPLTLTASCAPDCETPGAELDVKSTITTGVPWIGRIEVHQKMEMNRYAP